MKYIPISIAYCLFINCSLFTRVRYVWRTFSYNIFSGSLCKVCVRMQAPVSGGSVSCRAVSVSSPDSLRAVCYFLWQPCVNENKQWYIMCYILSVGDLLEALYKSLRFFSPTNQISMFIFTCHHWHWQWHYSDSNPRPSLRRLSTGRLSAVETPQSRVG